VELRSHARVFGDVESPVIVMEEGVLFEGSCRMTKDRPAEARDSRDLSVVSLKR
jgi:cytoskeletal protein CcmA (bactofilin family)